MKSLTAQLLDFSSFHSPFVPAFLLALAAALALTPIAGRLARWAGAIDMPEARRIHSVPTPRWGGLAVVSATTLSLVISVAFLAASRVALASLGWLAGAIACGGALLFAVGLIDDRISLRPRVKLVAEVAAAALVVFAGCRVRTLFGVEPGSLSIPVTIVWIVAVINAFNMVDGLDGLAAGLAVIIGLTLMLLSLRASANGTALLMASLCGASLGFLCYNFNPASIFLGDSGSLPLGFLMAVVSAEASGKGSTVASILVPVMALGLPLTELSLTILRRLLRAVDVVRSAAPRGQYRFRLAGKAALFTADRDHIHHRLLALGLSQRRATLLMYAACLAVNSAALMLSWQQRNSHEGVLVIGAAATLVACVHALGYRELQPVRNGLLLPLFPARLLERRSLQVCADLAFAAASMIGAYQVHPGPAWSVPSAMVVGEVALAQTGCLALGGLYRRMHPFASVQGVVVIARSIFYAGLATWLLFGLSAAGAFPSFVTLILDLYLFATLIIGYRVSFRLMDYIFNHSDRKYRRVLIYGTGEVATAALHTILGSPFLRMTVVGFVEEHPADGTSHEGLPVLGFDAFNAAGRKFDEVILPAAIPEKALKQLSARCKLAKLPLKRLSVDCTEVAAPDAREVMELSDAQPGVSQRAPSLPIL